MVLLQTWRDETVKSELDVKGGWGEGIVHGKAQLMVEVDIVNIRITTECYILVEFICSHSPGGHVIPGAPWPRITKDKEIYTHVIKEYILLLCRITCLYTHYKQGFCRFFDLFY